MNYYLQFYKESSYLFDNINFYKEHMNGFSHVKFDGEYIWSDQSCKDLTVEEGNIYASVWYKQSAISLYEYALNHPRVQIFVGGPICFHYDLTLKSDNYHVLRKDAEDEFFDGQTSEWNLSIPESNDDIGYSVSLTKGVGCYWGKCTFCKQIGTLTDRKMDSIPIIEHPGKKYIWLHTFAMSPRMIKKFYPTFPDRNDVKYSTYIRADRPVINALNDVLPSLQVDPKHLGFNVGIEFPSNHMLEHMKKGVTVKEYLDFIKLTDSIGSMLHFNLIIGWKNTTWDDVREVDNFLNQLYKISKPNSITVNLYPLIIVENRYVWDEYKNEKICWYSDTNIKKWPGQDQYIWDVKMGEPVLSKEQNKIKKRLQELYHSYPWLVLYDWTNDMLY